MTELSILQLTAIAIIFVWSGFVRSGIGFGGALFTLPFLLLVLDDPLIFLPIISFHLLFFASITVLGDLHKARTKENVLDNTTPQTGVNWWFVRYSMSIMIVPKIAGVIGLLVLPTELTNIIIFGLIAAYAMTYIFNKPMRSNNRIMDFVFLILGAYISGTSLVGGPLIIAVALRYIKPNQYRSTLFVLWFVLVSIKMAAFAFAGVDLQLASALLLLPVAGIGHFVGLKAHHWLLNRDNRSFYRNIGILLFITSCVGIGQSI